MGGSRFAVGVLALAVLLGLPSLAYAYDETTSTIPPISEGNCGGCHQPYFSIGPGVHGNYTLTSNKCAQCHTVHDAPTGFLLLPSETVKGTCFSCHDGTGGKGVYGAIGARGLGVGGGHRIDATDIVPGGDGTSGGATTMAFGGVGGTLTCSDCHSVHGSNVVDPFVGDRIRFSGIPSPIPTSKLLRQSPGTTTTVVTKYGSDWCLACHAGRSSGGSVHNHPVESSATVAAAFDYSNVALIAASGVDTANTVMGQMGGITTPVDSSVPGGNRGYLMPYPRTPEQTDHFPICMQCHEDSRSVGSLVGDGSLANVTPATYTTPDGTTVSDNPRFHTFPHETENSYMTVESDDDLCMNCHPAAALP